MSFNVEEYKKIKGKNHQASYIGKYFFNNISEMLELIDSNKFSQEVIKEVLKLREEKTSNTFLHFYPKHTY